MTPLIAAATAADITFFVVGALIVLGGAIGVVISRNPVRAALNLVLTLFGIAILFVVQEAHFLAAVQVIVYAGAIVVLFLFVIMLLGVDRLDHPDRGKLRSQWPFALIFAFATVGAIAALAGWDFEATGARSQGGVSSGEGTNIEKLADSIFTQYLFPFEATALLLVIAVVGAVYLSRKLPRSSGGTEEAVEARETTEDLEAVK